MHVLAPVADTDAVSKSANACLIKLREVDLWTNGVIDHQHVVWAYQSGYAGWHAKGDEAAGIAGESRQKAGGP